MAKDTITPLQTEKAYTASGNNEYIFSVPLHYNKKQIVQAVEEEFKVKVVSIKTLIQSGKAIRYSRGKNRYPGTTHRADHKKAYVRLAEGDSIQVFDEAPVEASAPVAAEKETK